MLALEEEEGWIGSGFFFNPKKIVSRTQAHTAKDKNQPSGRQGRLPIHYALVPAHKISRLPFCTNFDALFQQHTVHHGL